VRSEGELSSFAIDRAERKERKIPPSPLSQPKKQKKVSILARMMRINCTKYTHSSPQTQMLFMRFNLPREEEEAKGMLPLLPGNKSQITALFLAFPVHLRKR